MLAERHARAVPGKAREEMAAQDLAYREGEGEGENSPRIRRPQDAGEGEAEGGEEGEERRKPQDAEGQRPGELVRFHEKGCPEPPQARHEIAEAPAPADQERSEEHTSELQSRENLVCR